MLGPDVHLYVAGFFTGERRAADGGATLTVVVAYLTTCDFDNIITCRNRRQSGTFVGLAVALALLAVAYLVLPSAVFLLLGTPSILLVFMWYAYGYSPTCVPMVPECAVKDVLWLLVSLIPAKVEWPSALQKIQGCALNASIPHADCFVSCAAQPFAYAPGSWESTAAWGLCEINPEWCFSAVRQWAADAEFMDLSSLAAAISSKYWSIRRYKVLAAAAAAAGNDNDDAAYYAAQLRLAADRIAAERFCFVATSVNLLPYAAMAVLAFYVVLACASIPFLLLQLVVDVGAQALAYVHHAAGGGGGGGE